MSHLQAVLTRGRLAALPAKALNFLRNRRERGRGAVRLRSRPYGADIVTTRGCNLNCLMCIKYESKPPHAMPDEVFDRVADELFRRLIYVRFCSGGEHLTHPRFRDMLTRCRRAGAVVTLMTNAMLLDEDWADFLVNESSVWSIGVSFDAAEPETLESIRRGAKFDVVARHVQGLAAARRARRGVFPRLALRMTLMRRNIEQLPAVVQLASEWGVDAVNAGYLITPPHMDEQESLWHHRELVAPAFEAARREADARGVELNLPGLIEDRPRAPSLCALPWTQVYIDPNGDVRLCCNAWDDEGVMGNLMEQPFEDVWNGERYQRVRQSLLEGKPAYRRCINCAALAENPGARATHFME